MDNPIVVTALVGAAVSLLTGAITGLVTWSVAARKIEAEAAVAAKKIAFDSALASGQISTTDADRLWEQNDRLIQALTQDNGGLRSRVDSLTSENEGLRQRMHNLEIKAQQSELAESDCNERADRLAIRVAELEKALHIERPVEKVTVTGEHLAAHGPDSAAM